MNHLISEKKLVLVSLFCYSFCLAQKKIEIKYYENNTKLPTEDARILLVTKTDTTTLKIVKGNIQLAKGLKDNFTLFTQINGKTLKIGSYRRAAFEKIDAFILGRVTDFSILKKNWEFSNTFAIDSDNLITIPNWQNITDVIYCIVRTDVDVSLNTDVHDYMPTFTYSYEVIKLK